MSAPIQLDGPEHFPGCHPEDAEATQDGAWQGGEPEACWHCGTPTPQGCRCFDCLDSADVISPTAIFHCPACGRWWAYVTGLNITTITFGAESSIPTDIPAGPGR